MVFNVMFYCTFVDILSYHDIFSSFLISFSACFFENLFVFPHEASSLSSFLFFMNFRFIIFYHKPRVTVKVKNNTK